MSADSEHVTKAVEGALEQIQKNAPEEFSKLNADPKLKAAITEAAKAAATEQLKLAEEFCSGPGENTRERLAKHLPEHRIKMIEEALNIPTFRMELGQKSEGTYLVQLTRNGKEFRPDRELATAVDTKWASVMQLASILVEAVLLVLQAVGIEVSVSESTMEATIEDAVEAIEKSSKLESAIETFIASWKNAGDNAYEKAKAIFVLIKASYAGGILWTIIKSLCKEMKWYDWLETAAKVTAMIIAALATDGAALIAEIALIVLNAVDFARKIANILQLKEIKSTL